MRKLYQQDDCAPDSMEAFKEKLLETTNLTWEKFQELAARENTEMGYRFIKGDYIVEWNCDDPFYALYTVAPAKWYFTFGAAHRTPGGYSLANVVVEIEGDYGEARNKLVSLVGDMFAFQYHTAEDAGVDQFALTLVGFDKFEEYWSIK